MAATHARAILRQLHRLAGARALLERTDSQLLHDYADSRQEESFAALLHRHGRLVWSVCRHFLPCEHDAEDAFQATFLVLARRAASIRRTEAVASWLHGVAYRIASKARTTAIKRNRRETRLENEPPAAPVSDLAWRELQAILDEELQRLPEKYRSPFILCCLEGRSRAEVAAELGWKEGTLSSRIAHARTLLQQRLTRRGVMLSAALTAGVMWNQPASEALIGATQKAVTLIAAGQTMAAAARPTVAALVNGAGYIVGTKAKLAVLVLLAGIIGGTLVLASSERPAATDEQTKSEPKAGAALPKADERKSREDLHGDPLPTGSTLRFGTSRFRHGVPISTLAISPDGKIAVAVNGNHVLGAARVFDLVSGHALYTFEGSSGPSAIEAAAISPDERTIVTKQDFSVRVRDAATGKELRKIELQRANQYSRNEWVAFTPDGKAIAVTSQGGVVHLIDFESGKMIREFSNENPESSLGKGWETVLGIAFSRDGKLMATGGFTNDKGIYFARLWEVETGKELRRFMHGKTSYGIPSLAFSPDARTLGTRSHDGRLRLFDVDTGKERKTFQPDGGGRRLGTVAFSPDGKTVAAAGDSIRLYDLTTREERLRIDQKQVTGLQFTDGGKTLTGAVMGTVYRWDTATGKSLTPEGGDSIVEQIFVTADGSRVVTRGQDGDAHIWDGANGKHLRALNAAWQRGLAMSPDGRFLVWPVVDANVKFPDPLQPNMIHNGSRIHLYDIAADKFVDRFAGFKGDAHDLTFTHDGKKLVTVDHRDGIVRIWNVEAGKEERSFRAVPDAEKNLSNHVWRTTLSPDSKRLAVAYHPVSGVRGMGFRGAPYLVRLWDVTTGQEKHALVGHRHYVIDMAFSPDGRLLVTAGERESTFVWETATGKRVSALPDGLPIGASAVAFSLDGRFLATALPNGAIRLWEAATWTVRNEYKGHRDRPTTLTFAPGGQLLSGSLDTTVLAWEIRPPRVAVSVTFESAWNDLAKREAGEAFKTEGSFLAAPADAVKFFAEHVRPVEAPDPKRIQRLLDDLDSDQFAVRKQASAELEKLGELVAPALGKALKGEPSTEARRRIEELLKNIDNIAPQGELLRSLRAIEMLELIGTPAARKFLEKLATGGPEARLTREAQSALQRLERLNPRQPEK
jgi:RNA polymerase sigma factor (sigma-70 family)